ncbi:uncharacterized protein LOC120626733 isoform X2 [Pararge aegeria]|uniref:Jg10264 protein n=1 Tax=Pararge aegeria aegeria TaxID=348720 RepID=A0A8S4RUH8_9NEOP|nr:uncharacterized protein LOC120626733 isoform X2 [Pararge aegeria]CAH2241631.1 jg10264 [Pararge aegeria aegeria]
MAWTNDVALEFLDHYRIEPLLWDPKHPLHRNRCEVNEAWRRIQSNLSINSSIVDLKRKKESLMTSFRFHYNRKKKCPGEYRTTWFAYSFMESFLGGKYECDSTNENDHEDPIANTSPNTTVDRQSSNRRINRSSCSKSQTNNSEYVYSKRQLDSVNYVKEEKCKTDTDEYELYGQLLAKKLRKLDEHQRDVAMHEIDNIMFNAKMQSGPTQNRSFSTSPSPVPRKIKSPVFIITQQNHEQFEDENITYQEQQPS